MTLEAWVNPSTLSGGDGREVIYKDDYFLEAAYPKGGRPAAGGTFGAATVTVGGTTALTRNTWTHLAATYDGSSLRQYVNGVQVASVARNNNLATSTRPLEIGGDAMVGQYFAARIDDVRIYDVALMAAQVQADMNAAVDGDPEHPI